MKLKEFKYEVKEKKKQMLFTNGVYLASRRESNYTIYLFQVDSFYVEVYFYDDYEEMGYIKSFSSTDYLEPYLCQIKIPSVI